MNACKLFFLTALLGLLILSFSVLMAHPPLSLDFFLGYTDMELGIFGTCFFILGFSAGFAASTEGKDGYESSLQLICSLFYGLFGAFMLMLFWLVFALQPLEIYLSAGYSNGSSWLMEWVKYPFLGTLIITLILVKLTEQPEEEAE